jgi:hypothetical protein
MMLATDSVPDYFPVLPILFPVRAEQFPVRPPREFARNRLILLEVFCRKPVGSKKFPVIFPVHGNSSRPGVPA